MIDNRSIQQFLADAGLYTDLVDGDWGGHSQRAARAYLLAKGHPDARGWTHSRCKVAVQQCLMQSVGIHVGPIDGLVGPTFQFALEAWQNRLRGETPSEAAVAHQPATFPRQADVPAFYGAQGQGQVLVDLPFPMVLAWDLSNQIHRFSIHRKAADSAKRALAKALGHYGYDRLRELRLDRFGGCLNQRTMRGGHAPSMHSWGIAIDFDPDRNQLRWGRDRAQMARVEYKPFLDFWEAEGWISLGRERNYDWMHVQAARL
jgi:hypothetical protein